jgi:predicted Zn-dependent peptidase
MEDRTLPLVTLYARFDGGYALLPREEYAAATALPGLLRSGGTRSMPPDSVDNLLDFYALQLTFGGGGESMFSSINTLTRHLDSAVALWAEMLRNPGFDADEVEVWRGRQLESVRRRTDDPGLLAFSEFNRLMFGDHPIGWEMTEGDLAPERLSAEALARVHAKTFCPENLIFGVVGDVSWNEIEPLLESMMEGWPACTEPLLLPPIPSMREDGGVFLVPRDVNQSTVIMAQPGGIRQSADPDYFASRIGNSILGASGFSSRLLSRVRTEKGYAYSASSLWTTPYRYEGIVGALTQTKSESTIAATRLILETIQEMREIPPSEAEVDLAVQQIVNGFVFNFQDPAQIVSRQMFYLSQGLPEDWLERYLRGIQRVDPDDVRDVFRRYVNPSTMTIMILGNPDDFDAPPESLGEVRIWDIGRSASPPVTGPQRGGQQSPR